MLQFSLLPQEVPVTIDGKEYVLREASEAAAAQYENVKMASHRLSADGKTVSISNLGIIRATLVSACLFEKTPTGEKPVPFAVLNTWRSAVVDALFKEAKRISDIDMDETVEMMEKQIALLQAKIATKKGGDQAEGSPGN